MSFVAQESLLFRLLFDRTYRADYVADPQTILNAADLTSSERTDFDAMRVDALEIDAKMRIYMLLDHWCKSYPATFILLSARENGLQALRNLVDIDVMVRPPVERALAFGEKLQIWLQDNPEPNVHAQQLLISVQGFELAKASVGVSLRQAMMSTLETGFPVLGHPELPENWKGVPVTTAAHVNAVLLPQSYDALHKELLTQLQCQHTENLWEVLNRRALTDRELNDHSDNLSDPRLICVRAIPASESGCDPQVSYQILELSEGFAPIFQYFNGQFTIDQILQLLGQSGASPELLKGIEAGFRELFVAGMLVNI